MVQDTSKTTATPNPGSPELRPTADLNVAQVVSLVGPRQVKQDLPMAPVNNTTVVESREVVKNIIAGRDPRFLVVIGPCSIHDEAAALDYARRLHALQQQMLDRVYIVMRVYFEKPRTTVGWKGFINDPRLDGSFDIENGIRRARKLLLAITAMGLPVGTEVLDPITPQYIADLITWSAIGARTTESQTHRQMASGLSMPVGFKNSTEGNLQVALDALKSAGSSHSFLGIDDDGRTAIVTTRGNKWGHVILRGGRERPNYDPQSIADALARLAAAKLPTGLMVDCSHANANKKFQNQELVWRSVIEQRLAGNRNLMGIMVESNLGEGAQPLTDDLSKLRYGVSITDECIGWDKTESLLRGTYADLA